jgi:ketosteroid isomerase-like protein
MARTIVSLLVGIALVACVAEISAAELTETTEAAVKSVESWLALVDSGDYAASWRQAAEYFKNAVTEERWRQAVAAVRGPLGAVVTRKLKATQEATELPGAPDGQYVVIQFDTTFDNKKGAVETVTAMKQDDGSWRVAGYFVK